MLSLTIPRTTLWDETKEEFVTTPEETLVLEHSLDSLSKWESITEKPFLGKEVKTQEETLQYIKCMTISPVSSEQVFLSLTSENFNQISDYIDAKMTATTFVETPGGRNTGEYVSAEIIYYWMITLNIPMECKYWHLNRLLALVRVINLKNQPEKKMSRRDSAARQRQLNQERRARMNTNG